MATDEVPAPDAWADEVPVLAGLAAASVQGTVALGPHRGARLRRLGDPPESVEAPAHGGCHVRANGFDLHAGLVVPAGQRERLERACRYALRPPVTFVQPGIFRLYLYDDMTRPLSASNLSGRITMADNYAREVGPSIPLVFGRTADHSTMEARIPGMTFPFNVKLFMKFKPNEREHVFDFSFRDYSREP
jgi:hypothetical protein